MMKKYMLFAIVIFAFMGCSKNDAAVDEHFNKALEFRQNEKIGESITELGAVIKDSPENPRAAEAQFEIGKIYLNDVKDYEIAIEEFQKVIDQYPESEFAPKALFMIGYIEANNLQAYSDALEDYQNFIKQYPDHELVPSVQYELDSMSEVSDKIVELNSRTREN
ncbi:MAG: tetratricopeptide repeat protein [FCB group bacterium]|nr:tetratricopeptide repeat protein [FCB group bacterium]